MAGGILQKTAYGLQLYLKETTTIRSATLFKRDYDLGVFSG